MERFDFPAWTNKFLAVIGGGVVLFGGYAATMGFFASSPDVISVGYAPPQPVPYSHALHVGKLKLDCRYCHNTVEQAAHAAIPPTATCGNCHSGPAEGDIDSGTSQYAAVKSNSNRLHLVRESLATGQAIPWIRVHNAPDFVYFNHAAHVTKGVGCNECHGRVDRMEIVTQVEPLSMSFCLECHRNPKERLRPLDQVTNLEWQPPTVPSADGGERPMNDQERDDYFTALAEELGVQTHTNCSTCHR